MDHARELATTAPRFTQLVTQCKALPRHHSDLASFTNSEPYRAIVALGPDVVPLLLAELEREPDWWFRALTELTGVCLTTDANRGSLERLTTAWIQWGKGWVERSNGLASTNLFRRLQW